MGTTPKAIRTYHTRGLVPEPRRDESGYRRYGASTLVRLARVRRLRELGLSLAAIEPLLRGGDGGAALRAELRALDAELAEQLRRLRARRALIAGLLREGIDDPIAVSAADAWEEFYVAWLHHVLPDLTPQGGAQRAALSAGDQRARPADHDPPASAARVRPGPRAPARLAATHRRFHALAEADTTTRESSRSSPR